MVQKSVIIFGVFTFAVCVTLFLLSIFVLVDRLQYDSTDKVTNSNLSDALYQNINNFYGYQCYAFAFEIYTNLDCETYLGANLDNPSIKYFNDNCYSENSNSNGCTYTTNDVKNFCTFFKNPNFCNVYGY